MNPKAYPMVDSKSIPSLAKTVTLATTLSIPPIWCAEYFVRPNGVNHLSR